MQLLPRPQNLPHPLKGGRAQGAVDQAHAVQQHRGGECPDQDVLNPGLVGAGFPLGVGRHHVEAEAQELQGDVGRQKLVGRNHHHHSQHRQHDQAVEFPRVLQVLIYEVPGSEHHHRPDYRQEHLEEDCIVVDDVDARVQLTFISEQRERRPHYRQQSSNGQEGQYTFHFCGNEQVHPE